MIEIENKGKNVKNLLAANIMRGNLMNKLTSIIKVKENLLQNKSNENSMSMDLFKVTNIASRARLV